MMMAKTATRLIESAISIKQTQSLPSIPPPPQPLSPPKKLQQQAVHVQGTSDARVSQGLVAVVAQGLTGANPKAVLELEPEGLATVSGSKKKEGGFGGGA
jgi:hypothetical protein